MLDVRSLPRTQVREIYTGCEQISPISKETRRTCDIPSPHRWSPLAHRAAKQEMTMTGRSTLVAIAIFVAATMVPKVALAQKLSDAEVKRLATSTATAADHKKLAAHYRAHAAEHEADAKLHEDLVTALRKDSESFGHAWELARGAAHYAEALS
jgi:hypothetical protein